MLQINVSMYTTISTVAFYVADSTWLFCFRRSFSRSTIGSAITAPLSFLSLSDIRWWQKVLATSARETDRQTYRQTQRVAL